MSVWITVFDVQILITSKFSNLPWQSLKLLRHLPGYLCLEWIIVLIKTTGTSVVLVGLSSMINNPPRALSWSNARPCALKIQELIICSHQEMLYRVVLLEISIYLHKICDGDLFCKSFPCKGIQPRLFSGKFSRNFQENGYRTPASTISA